MALEILAGRWLACCVYPALAWSRLPRGGRAAIVATYFAAAYAAVLMALLAL